MTLTLSDLLDSAGLHGEVWLDDVESDLAEIVALEQGSDADAEDFELEIVEDAAGLARIADGFFHAPTARLWVGDHRERVSAKPLTQNGKRIGWRYRIENGWAK